MTLIPYISVFVGQHNRGNLQSDKSENKETKLYNKISCNITINYSNILFSRSKNCGNKCHRGRGKK